MHRSLKAHTAHRYGGELNSLRMLELLGLVMNQINPALKSARASSATLAPNALQLTPRRGRLYRQAPTK